jgi:hypothetical protein
LSVNTVLAQPQIANVLSVTDAAYPRSVEIRTQRASVHLFTPRKGEGRMSSFIGGRALTVGAGIGGLSAAGALAPFFEQIIILERDRLMPAAVARRGSRRAGTLTVFSPVA